MRFKILCQDLRLQGLAGLCPVERKSKLRDHKSICSYIGRTPGIRESDLIVRKCKETSVGKVFVDWSQNDEHKTTICVHSLRAKEHPTVSTPVSWKEVANARKNAILVY